MDAQPYPSETNTPAEPAPSYNTPQRVFLHEPGWSVALKVGSERVFCYQMAPGQDYYHRLLDGEIHFTHGDERLCLACAERRGLLSFEPKGLRQPLITFEIELGPGRLIEPGEFKVVGQDDDEGFSD